MGFKGAVKSIIPKGAIEAYEYAKMRDRMRRQSRLSDSEVVEAIVSLYEENTGRPIDLGNPRTFNEKIQWMKAFHSTPKYGKLADKYLVREFVANRIGEEYLTKLYGVWDDVQGIDFDRLPNQFVLKATHGCGWNIIVKDKSKLDQRRARRKLKRWLKLNYAYVNDFELHYNYCEPRVIAEEYLANCTSGDGPDELYDIKFFCFSGKVKCIAYYEGRGAGDTHRSFFSPEWEVQPFRLKYPVIGHEVQKPEKLDEMIELSERLACGLPQVRVDFYCLDDGRIVFGEMTLTTGGGIGKWDPPEADEILGDYFQLPKE